MVRGRELLAKSDFCVAVCIIVSNPALIGAGATTWPPPILRRLHSHLAASGSERATRRALLSPGQCFVPAQSSLPKARDEHLPTQRILPSRSCQRCPQIYLLGASRNRLRRKLPLHSESQSVPVARLSRLLLLPYLLRERGTARPVCSSRRAKPQYH